MSYSWILIGFIVLIILAEIYFIGKYFSKANNIFLSNEFGVMASGATIYFAITFFAFFPLVWIEPSILAYVVIFMIKELIQISFLVLRRDVFSGVKINYKALLSSVFVAFITPVIFNYGIAKIRPLNSFNISNDFQSWFEMQKVISTITTISASQISRWLLASVSAFVIYNYVASFVIRISKRKSIVDYIISFCLMLFFMIVFNFGFNISYLMGIYGILFIIQLAYEMIDKSRRRYAVLFGLMVVNMWFFDPRLFLVYLVVATVTIAIYAYLRKPKVSMFFVQLFAPLAIISSLLLYPKSPVGALIVVLCSIFLYLFFIGGTKINQLSILNNILIKLRIVTPIILFVSIIIASIAIGYRDNIKVQDAIYFTNSIFNSYENEKWEMAQTILLNLSYVIMFVFISYIYIFEKRSSKVSLILFMSAGILFFGYNYASKILIDRTEMVDQFVYLRFAAFAPLIPLIVITTKEFAIKKLAY